MNNCDYLQILIISTVSQEQIIELLASNLPQLYIVVIQSTAIPMGH